MVAEGIYVNFDWLVDDVETSLAQLGPDPMDLIDAANRNYQRQPVGDDGPKLGGLGTILQVGGTLTRMVSAFYQKEAAVQSAESQASSLEFESDMAEQAARDAEDQAQSVLRAGQTSASRSMMRAGAAKAGRRTRFASRGLQLGFGSTAEVQASGDIIKEIDAYTIEANAVQAAGQARRQGTAFRNRALLGRVSAGNARRSAGAVDPFASAFGTGIETAAELLAAQILNGS